jgi:hypothetical protein
MRPVSENAHIFVRGLTLAHFDATMRRIPDAQRFLDSDVGFELAFRGVEAMIAKSEPGIRTRDLMVRNHTWLGSGLLASTNIRH